MLRISKMQINYKTLSATNWERWLQYILQDIWDSNTYLVRSAGVAR